MRATTAPGCGGARHVCAHLRWPGRACAPSMVSNHLEPKDRRPCPRPLEIQRPPRDDESLEDLEEPAVHVDISAADWRRDRARREWMMIGLALSCLITLMAIIFAVFAFTDDDDRARRAPRRGARPRRPAAPAADGRGADAGRGQGHRVREVREGRRDAAGGAGRARSRSSRSTFSSTSHRYPRTSRRRRSGASRSTASTTAAPASRRPMVVTEGDTVDFTLVNGSSKAMKRDGAALDGFPRGRGQPRQALRGPRPRQVDALPLRRQAPGRLHVPLRHPAGADAHGHGHGRDVRGEAEDPRAGRQRAVDDAAGVLPRSSPARAATWPRWRPRSRT